MSADKYQSSDRQKTGDLEKHVGGRNDFVDTRDVDVIREFRNYVCQIMRHSTGGSLAIGTGFLVGRNRVLTNFHVIEGIDPSNLHCRFDVNDVGADDYSAGPAIEVEEILAKSKYSEIEVRGYTRESLTHPSLDELDYALLKIEHHPIERDWLDLLTFEPEIHSKTKVYILQHPKGSALKVASDAIADHQPPNNARFRYLTDTEPGSSGSPCFCWSATDTNGKSSLILKALHNYGDPGSEFKNPEFNHGIPIHLIAQHLKLKDELPPHKPKRKKLPFVFRRIAVAAVSLLVMFGAFKSVNYWRFKDVVPEFGYSFSKVGSGWITGNFISAGIENAEHKFQHPNLEKLSEPKKIEEFDLALYDVGTNSLNVRPPVVGQDVVITGYPVGSFFPKSYKGSIFVKDGYTWYVIMKNPDKLSIGMAGGIVSAEKTKEKLGIMLYHSAPFDIDGDGTQEYTYSFVAFSDVYNHLNKTQYNGAQYKGPRWVYAGQWRNGKWETTNFSVAHDTEPSSLVGTHQEVLKTVDGLSVRAGIAGDPNVKGEEVTGLNRQKVGSLTGGDKVQVTDVEGEHQIWFRIE